MSNDYYDFLLELLNIDSIAPNEAEVAAKVAAFMRSNLACDQLLLQEVAPGRANVILTRGRPRVTLTTHLDTVPGTVPVTASAHAITGRGACDAKGQIVAQVWALAEAAARGATDYACFFVVGEEVDSAGARAAAEHPALGSAFLVNGEPTGNRFVARSRGVLECTLGARGVPGHSSLPACESAIHKLVGDLHGLLEHAGGAMAINAGVIAGGVAPNVIADRAEAELCVRFDGPSRQVLQDLRQGLRHSELRLRSEPVEAFRFFVPPGQADPPPIAAFCSDAPLYAARFGQVMLFGPGSIALAHGPEESILRQDLEQAKDVLAALVVAS